MLPMLRLSLLLLCIGGASCQKMPPERPAPPERLLPEQVICHFPPVPVWGYRLAVSGDFNGDGRQDTLTERYISQLTGQETYKYYRSPFEYDDLIAHAWECRPKTLLVSTSLLPDTILMMDGGNLGLYFLHNEGDLDGDGGDEISYAVDLADWSNLNHAILLSRKNEKWQELVSSEIREPEIPNPEIPDYQPLSTPLPASIKDSVQQNYLFEYQQFTSTFNRTPSGRLLITRWDTNSGDFVEEEAKFPPQKP